MELLLAEGTIRNNQEGEKEKMNKKQQWLKTTIYFTAIYIEASVNI